jgi:hypothetical protein
VIIVQWLLSSVFFIWFFTGWFYNMGELVECHSGFIYAEKPVALTWENRRLEIIQITAAWRSPEKRHFRVRTGNGQAFELSYPEADDECPENTSGYRCPENTSGYRCPENTSGYRCPENTSGYRWQITQL